MANPATRNQDTPELFLTKQQHLDFRGYTYLLSLCDKVANDRPISPSDPHRATHDSVTAAYSNTIVRQSRYNVSIKIYGDMIAVINKRNAKQDESVTQPSIVDMNAVVLQPDVTELEQSEDIIDFVLEKTFRARDNNLNEIPFTDHISYYLSLLRSCHAASTDKESKLARERFRDYVLFSSLDKIASRLRIGRKRNFQLILTMKPGDISDEQYTEGISTSLRELTPNPKQSQLRYDLFKALRYSNEHAEAKSKRPIFDKGSRKQFHQMLVFAVRGVYVSQEKLSDVMDSLLEPSLDRQAIQAKSAEIAELYCKFRRKLTFLHRFLNAFDVGEDEQNTLLAHLSWLYNTSVAMSQLNNCELFQTVDGIQQSGLEDVDSSPLNSENEEEHDDSDGKDFAHLESWPRAALQILRNINIHSESIALATNIHPTANKNSSKQRRESRLVKESTVLALDVRSCESEHTRTSLADCIDQLIASHAAEQNGKPSNLNKKDILDIIYHSCAPKVKGAMTEKERQKLEDKFNGETLYGGSVHCETMLVAAAVCARRSDIAKGAARSNIEFMGLLTAGKDARQFVSASKRCCPVCWKVVDEASKRYPEVFGKEFNEGRRTKDPSLSSSCSKRTAVSLPSFLPLTIAGPVLEYVQSAAAEALIEIQGIVNDQKEKRDMSRGCMSEDIPRPCERYELPELDDDEIELRG